MEMMLWNALLTTFIGLLAWNLKEKSSELNRVTILLNKTREEIARDSVTQAEIEKIVAHMDARFDKLSDKIDSFMREQRSAHK
jgi:DNA polymerase II small subunit/DNA polymerase delta subunit B